MTEPNPSIVDSAAPVAELSPGGSPTSGANSVHAEHDAPGHDLSAAELSSRERAEARAYGRAQLACGLADRAIDGVYLGLMGLVLAGPLDGWLARWVGNDYLRLPCLLAIAWMLHELCSLPLAFYAGHVLETRFGLSRQSAVRWFRQHLKQFALSGVLSLLVLEALFAIIRWTGDLWWLVAAGMYFVLSVALGQLVPVVILPLFYRIERLPTSELLDRFARLAEGTGLSLEGVYRIALSAETVKANAMLAGLGRTRRVLLGDTLLARFSPAEIEVIFAHEVGHHVHRHLPKLLALGVVLSAAGFAATDAALRSWLGVARWSATPFPVAGMPLVLFALWVFGSLSEPWQNAISRHFERQSDRYALERTGDRAAYGTAFRKLARLNKDDPDPHPLEVFLFHGHPPIAQRLAAGGVTESARRA